MRVTPIRAAMTVSATMRPRECKGNDGGNNDASSFDASGEDGGSNDAGRIDANREDAGKTDHAALMQVVGTAEKTTQAAFMQAETMPVAMVTAATIV